MRARSVAIFMMVALASIGGLAASAATLGGIAPVRLGADKAAVPECDSNGFVVSYTNTYNPATGLYRTTAVVLGDIASTCAGKALAITVKNAAGASLATGTITSMSGATTQTVTLGAPIANAANVAGVAWVVTG